MKVVFISGPYRAPDMYGIHKNIMAARKAAIELWKQGYAVICPHMNTAHFDGILPDETWLNGDIEIMKKCDAIYFLKTWRQSAGAKAEYQIALEHGIECIFEPE